MTTDLYSQSVLFNDGEGAEPDDMNEVQRLVHRQLVDNMLGSLVPDAIDSATSPGGVAALLDFEMSRGMATGLITPNDLAFTTSPGCGYWRPTTNANELAVVPGNVIQLIDDLAAPTDTAFAQFRLGDYGATDITVQTAQGDASLPRIDLIEVKLEYVDSDQESRDFEDAITGAKSTTTPYKRRRVQATVQVKAGTPNVTPHYPAPSAGFVAMCAVWIPVAHNAVHAITNVRDLRVPLGGVRVYDVPASQFSFPGAAPWTYVVGNPSPFLCAQGPASGTGYLYAVCPVTSAKARLIGIGCYSRDALSAELYRMEHNLSSVPTMTLLADLDGGFYSMLNGTGDLTVLSMTQLMYQLADQTAVAGPPATSLRVGSPIWCNAHPAGPARTVGAYPQTPSPVLAVRIGGNATSFVSFVRFIVAEGL